MSCLSTSQLEVKYGDFQALFGIDFELHPGEAVAIIGANGAGKSTFLKSLAGQVAISSGDYHLGQDQLAGCSAKTMVEHGIVMVPEGRRLFPSLTVEENLRIGASLGREGDWDLAKVYELFPILAERRDQPGTALSGGQQQMVAIGRGLMANPDYLLFDEISLGLAPTMIKDIYKSLPKVRQGGTSIVIVEQDINQALKVCDRFYCFQEGRISLSGKPDEVDRETIKAAYFGV